MDQFTFEKIEKNIIKNMSILKLEDLITLLKSLAYQPLGIFLILRTKKIL